MLVAANGSSGARVGGRLLVGESGRLDGEMGDPRIEAKAIELARATLGRSGPTRPQLFTLDLQRDLAMDSTGSLSLYVEPHNQDRWRVWVFGAGHVAQRLCRALILTECEVTCVDARREWVAALPASNSLERLCRAEPADLVEELTGNEYVLCVGATAQADAEVLRAALQRGLEFPYVGVIGDRPRRKEVAEALVAAGVAKETALGVRCPIGEPSGDADSGAIALTAAAELARVRLEQVAKA